MEAGDLLTLVRRFVTDLGSLVLFRRQRPGSKGPPSPSAMTILGSRLRTHHLRTDRRFWLGRPGEEGLEDPFVSSDRSRGTAQQAMRQD